MLKTLVELHKGTLSFAKFLHARFGNLGHLEPASALKKGKLLKENR